jgi:ribonuclease HII
MPWIIGIDEAGYGPNLGPFVMTSVACRVPADQHPVNLWELLQPAVRRRGERSDGRRILVEDSKLVYSPTRGLRDLELGVLATITPSQPSQALCLAHCVDRLCPAAHPDLRSECWYSGATALPIHPGAQDFGTIAERFGQVSKERGVAWGLIRSIVVCPTRFNALLDRWDSKGVVLSLSLTQLLQHNANPDDGTEPVSVFVDKHGGRNAYAAVLQQAYPDGVVVAREEGKDRSVYRLEGGKRAIELTFEPRADAAHFCVALASMVSKYLREVLMLEFNAFWQTHVPGLKPTAGYPVDAVRFLEAIRPALTKLGIAETAVWRRK